MSYLVIFPFEEYEPDDFPTAQAAASAAFAWYPHELAIGAEVLVVQTEHVRRFELGAQPVTEETGKAGAADGGGG